MRGTCIALYLQPSMSTATHTMPMLSVAQMTHRSTLDDNAATSLVACLELLPSVQELRVWCGAVHGERFLTALPRFNLRSFSLSCRLSAGHITCMGKMATLTSLTLSSMSAFSRFPDASMLSSLSSLRSLTLLNFQHNACSAQLAAALSALSLTRLHLSAPVPGWQASSSALRALVLDSCNLHDLPDTMQLPSLCTFEVRQPSLTVPAAALGAATEALQLCRAPPTFTCHQLVLDMAGAQAPVHSTLRALYSAAVFPLVSRIVLCQAQLRTSELLQLPCVTGTLACIVLKDVAIAPMSLVEVLRSLPGLMELSMHTQGPRVHPLSTLLSVLSLCAVRVRLSLQSVDPHSILQSSDCLILQWRSLAAAELVTHI